MEAMILPDKSNIPIKQRQQAFEHVDIWVFDLDNTLYPASSSLFPQIHVKMTEFVQKALNLSKEAASKLQRDYYYDHGTTLNGLMINHNIAPADFLDYVHDIDHSVLEKNTALHASIKALKGKKYIFTNGTVKHAINTLEPLGLSGLFDDMFDIVGTNYIPKPEKIAFDRFFSYTGLDPQRASMFEDLEHNLQVPHAYGMKTILVTDVSHPDFSDPEMVKADQINHVDFVTSNLADFLKPLGLDAHQG